MASELFSAIEGQYSIKALQNILANLENVNLKNSRGETALAAVIRLCTDGRPRKGVDFQEFESYIVKAVQLFIDAGVDVNLKNLDGQSVIEALMTSNYRGEKLLEILEILIEAGADVNSSNRIHQTALHLAAKDQFNQIEFIRFLLQRGVNVDYRDYYGFTALHCAVEKGNKEVVQCLIDAGADVSLKNRGGETALYLAAKNNNPNQVDFIRFLLQRGADVNSQDSNGSTALQYAVRNKNKEVIQFLIDVGADVNLKDKKGQSVIEALITSRYRGVQLMLEILEVLIKAGADVNSRNKYGETALHLAAKEQYNQVDFIRNLLKHGADVDSQDVFQFTALQYAVQKQNKEVVACLIDAGSDVNLKNKNGQTALHLAADNYYPNQVDFIRFLLQRGADVNSQDSNGSTALQYAARNQNKEVVQFLWNEEADINEMTLNGETPLHLAAKTINVDLIKYFITRGADVNAKDGTTGKTPLHSLMNRRFEDDKLLDALEVLLSAGADVNAVELSYGNTPLHYCIVSQIYYYNFFIDLKYFFKVLTIFIKYRADFKIKNLRDETPMEIFLKNCYRYENVNYSIVLDTFIKYGLMDVESLFTSGWDYNETIVHKACYSLNYKMIKFLVNYGADIEVVNYQMETPLLALIRRLSGTDGTSDNCKILDYFLGLNPDVNVITDEGHILNYHSSYYPKFVWKALIEHIAKKQSTGYLLHVDIAQTISYDTYNGYQSYLDKCTEELKSLQDLKFPWVNFYDILMDSKKKLDCYAKNKELVQEFNELSLAQTYPIYGPHIVKRFSKAVKKQEVKEKSAVILSSCLPCHMDPSHLVIKKIISYLKGKHLKYLCEPESEELKKKLKMEEFKISFDKYVGSYYKI